MLLEAEHDESTFVDNIRDGFDLVGAIPKSDVYKKRVRPASTSVDKLRQSASKTHKAIIQSTRGSEDAAVDIGVAH